MSVARVVIAGGGIGGIASAIGLRRLGMDVVVLERAPELLPVGAGLHIWSNAMRAFQQLALDERVIAVGSRVEHMQFLRANGRLLSDWPVGDIGRRLGAPSVGVARADLHRQLLDALGGDVIRLGAEVEGFTEDDDGVTVRTVDGREERGDLLVGADGLRSAVRRQLLGDAKPRYAGYTAWRAIVGRDYPHELAPVGTFKLYWGRGARFLYYHIGGDRLYWEAIANAAEGERDPDGGRRQAVEARYRGWHETVRAILAHTDETAILRTDIVDRAPTPRWGSGRVTLLGDAAHPMTHTLGQGGNQAIEDVAVLVECLETHGATPAALRAYEQRRIGRTARVTRLSRNVGALSRVENPVACHARDAVLRVMTNTVARRQQEKDMAYRF